MNLTDKQLEEIIEKHPTHNICNLHSLSIHISPDGKMRAYPN